MRRLALKKKKRFTKSRAFTLAIIPNSQHHKREWRISYAAIYFVFTMLILLGVVLIFSIWRQAPVTYEKKESAELAAAWIARWNLLENGKNEIRKNLDQLKEIGDDYYKTIFKAPPELENFSSLNPSTEQNAKILPLKSVMRLLTAREEAYISMPIGIAIHSNQITSLYGGRVDPFGLETSFHTGIDFAAGTGTPIYATADGVVVTTDDAGESGLGKYVKILHKYGIMTVYGHMSLITTTKDKKVKRGDKIGEVGSTGRSTGPHLHYEVHVKNQGPETWFDLTYNPMPFIKEQL
ncbi:MAG: hypothetical protein LDLANPLL_01158 [Turneriella sp.]|nr:hypothetical protein [Turneriella sp.]